MPKTYFSSTGYASENNRLGHNYDAHLRRAAPPFIIIEDVVPYVPAALPDGLIPTSALTPSLLVRAPIIRETGYVTRPGDVFTAILADSLIPESRVTYSGNNAEFVELEIPTSAIDALGDGVFELSYQVELPMHGGVLSGKTNITVDRTKPGGRYLPPPILPDVVLHDGLSLSTLLSLPDQQLPLTIPDYDQASPMDRIELILRTRTGEDVAIKSFFRREGEEITTVGLTHLDLTLAGSDGRIELSYRVEDRAGNTSESSIAILLNLFLFDAPRTLERVSISNVEGDVITDNNAKSGLLVNIPMSPVFRTGDVIVLAIDKSFVGAIRISSANDASINAVGIRIAYNDVWDVIGDDDGNGSVRAFSYAHYRDGVASHSEVATYRCDLSVAGSRDPDPSTRESEALSAPILRGRSGGTDNHIGLKEIDYGAAVVLTNTQTNGISSDVFEPGDIITAYLAEFPVGTPFIVKDRNEAILINVSSEELKDHAGTTTLTYSAERHLSIPPHSSIATSPSQRVRIDSEHLLPGGGKPLDGAVFVDALALENDQGVYGIHESALVKGYTPIRIYGYTNISVGDHIEVAYIGFDAFEGGRPLPGVSGKLRHIVVENDVVPKDGDKSIYLDLHLDSAVVYTLAFGRFETTYSVTNSVGDVTTVNRTVIVSARRPTP